MPSPHEQHHPAHWQSRIGQLSERLVNEQMLNAHRTIVRSTNYDELTFLDAGCGTGGLTRELIDDFGKPERIYGCDIDQQNISACEKSG